VTDGHARRAGRLRGWARAAAVAAGLGSAAIAGEAHAIEYEIFVDVDDEEDLYELYASGQIGEDSYLSLLEIMRRGTDLDTADREELYALPNLTYAEVDRILAYRTEANRLRDPAALVPAGVLSQRKLAAIAAFLRRGEPPKVKAPVSGFAQYQTIWTAKDTRVPPMSLQARVTTLRHLTIGIGAFLTRNRLGPVTWDPNRQALTAEGIKPRVRLPKAFVQWDTPEYGVIAGSYRIGFGQRLTFDNSGRYTPNGFYLDDALVFRRGGLTRLCKESTGELDGPPCDTDVYVTPDHTIRVGLLGAAAGAKHIPVKDGWLQLYGFFSYQPRDIYQYQIYDRNVCDDPNVDTDDNPQCSSPSVFNKRQPLLAETSEFSFQTLPNMFDLVLGGGNFAWFHDRRTHVGVTGYGAQPRWLVGGADLDFRPYSPFPGGGAFGAVGADASWGYRWADVFAEVSRSFDREQQPGFVRDDPDDLAPLGGGFAGILRHTATWDVHEIEASVRYYDDDYNNPFARPIAATDQSGGVRASDEVGGRIRYSAFLGDRAATRTFLDLWSDTRGEQIQLRAFARADVDATKWFRPGLWFEYRDRNLRSAERVLGVGTDSDPLTPGQQVTESFCDLGDAASTFDSNDSFVTDTNDFVDVDPDAVDGESLTICTGERYSVTPRLRFAPHKRVWFLLQYRHDFVEDGNYPDGIRHDANAYFQIAARPIDPLRLRMRWRYYSDDIADSARLEESVWGYLDVSYRVARWLVPRLRYDIVFFLDDRESTQTRQPNPEHWLMLEIESRF
jgi:hypothetical protein